MCSRILYQSRFPSSACHGVVVGASVGLSLNCLHRYYVRCCCARSRTSLNLPGLPTLGFKIYSGYVTVDEEHGRALFYYFVEAQFNPQSKPLTLWLNGGPGCSSLIGNFVEHGPFTVRDNAIVLNPSSWNQAQDSFKFLQGWVEKFPEYQNRTFYITGESYSGYYVPQLAALIVKNNSSTPSLQLKGIMIGNPSLILKRMWGMLLPCFTCGHMVRYPMIRSESSRCVWELH
ncbi:hypothetical protein Mapa_012698 [Marchantia paleacea]|nr:hypothetical protein Mapa_012698 [Marchantia paleacea]